MDAEFSQSLESVECFDYVEISVRLEPAPAGNPFTEVSVQGEFRLGDGPPVQVEGFCDAADGTCHLVRFMPRQAGAYSYKVRIEAPGLAKEHAGSFEARDAARRGIVKVDPEHPWHFLWEGTGEHYFWNATTTYWLVGWDDETIRRSIDRLGDLKVNRVRAALDGRVKDGSTWYEPAYPTDDFSFLMNPWVAERPDSLEDPGFDVTRFNVDHWRKYERMVGHARSRDVVVSVVFYVDGARGGTEPFGKERMGGEDEQRYYRYALARLSAFSNVMWDVTNEYRHFRDDPWAEKMGALIKERDPYGHAISVHGHGDFRFRKSPWADFAMYQHWDEEGGHKFMLENRKQQAETGRPIPQVNEEYGYEDHYPVRWGGNRRPPARSADNRRRVAWAIYMAGCYQTTGERANTGTGWGPDTGGGWINGRGDDGMTMLEGYGRIVDFFTRIEWWKTEPRSDLVGKDALCLAEPGRQYVVYLYAGGDVTIELEPGGYDAKWFDPRNGEYTELGLAKGPKWTSPKAPDLDDWALLLTRIE